MSTPHIHADIIKAWADGAEVEVDRNDGYGWVYMKYPAWNQLNYNYRLKKQKKWFRVAEFKQEGGTVTYTSNLDSSYHTRGAEQHWEQLSTFIRWLTERIEYGE